VLGFEPVPDASESLHGRPSKRKPQSQQVGLKCASRPESARAKVAYQLKGVPVEEWLRRVVTVRAQPMPVFSAAGWGNQQLAGEARFLFAMRARPAAGGESESCSS